MAERLNLPEQLNRVDQVEGSSDRSFGLTFAAVGAVVALWPLTSGSEPRWWLLASAAALAAISFIAAPILHPLNRLWLGIGLMLHRIVSPVVLGVVFYGVLTPTGLILRARGKDLLRLRLDKGAASYWITREPPGPTPKSMHRQF